jgi:integral membrane sensor domain MASE1
VQRTYLKTDILWRRQHRGWRNARMGHAVTRFPGLRLESLAALDARGLATYALELIVVGAAYFVLAKVFLALDPIYPGGVPIWPATGFALAAVLLRGYRVWPAIFAGAWIAGASAGLAGDAGLIFTAAAIAAGNTLAALAARFVIPFLFFSPGGTTRGLPFVALVALVSREVRAISSVTKLPVLGLPLLGASGMASDPTIAFTFW